MQFKAPDGPRLNPFGYSPSRPCWSFFSDLLGRNIVPEKSPVKARAQLRGLLEELIHERPYLLMAKILNSSPAMRGQMNSFVKCLMVENQGTTIFEKPPGDNSRETGRSMNPPDRFAKEAWDYVLSRWWVMGDGQPTEARAAHYKELGTSTKEPVRAWLPEKSGVITYLRQRTTHILIEYFEELAKRQKFISLNSLQEGKRFLTADGEMFSAGMDIDQEGEVQSDQGRHRARQARWVNAEKLEKHLSGKTIHTSTEKPRRDPLKDLDEGILDAQARHPKNWPIWVFDAFATKTDEYINRLSNTRASLRRLIDRLAHFDSDIRCDIEQLKKIVMEWNGEPGLVEAFPEIAQACIKHRKGLAGIIDRDVRPGVRLTGRELVKARADVKSWTRAAAGNGPAPITKEDHQQLARSQVSFSELMNGAPIGDLNDARPDLVYLSDATGMALDPKEEPRSALEKMVPPFLASLESRGPQGGRLAHAFRVRGWNPDKESLADALRQSAALIPKLNINGSEKRYTNIGLL